MGTVVKFRQMSVTGAEWANLVLSFDDIISMVFTWPAVYIYVYYIISTEGASNTRFVYRIGTIYWRFTLGKSVFNLCSVWYIYTSGVHSGLTNVASVRSSHTLSLKNRRVFCLVL